MNVAAWTGVVGVVVAASAGAPAAEPDLLGFTTESSAASQRTLEGRFDAQLRAEDLRAWMERLAARPHHLGSAYDKANADFLAEQFRAWGFETALEEFEVLFPTPRERRVEMVAPVRFQAALREPALPQDATSGQAGEQLPVYNAYSIDGDVTAPLVYVNYGVPKDYEELERRGIDVRGKLVIARYGGSWRGIKPKVAAEHGAVGCLIYSDPRDDGYFQGAVYPEGPYRNEHGAQRGSVADMPLFPGDPLTPGVGARPGAARLELKDAPTLTRIPVLPLAYGDALPLLRALEGPMAPEGWRGALPIAYRLGPGPAKVRLKVSFDWNRVKAYDVIARLAGGERPDQWVIRGNHHDAWVNGADDPVSGLVALLAEARAVGELRRAGWAPRRTLVYAAWDGEEQGLLGSTEWAEAHAEELQRHAVAYLNSDSNGRGFLSMMGSHSLEPFINQVAREVSDPQRGISVAARLRASRLLSAEREQARELRERTDLRIAALGSGSDYTPFLQHLGVASLNLGFGGEDGGGSYHSVYDSIDHYTRFGDPKFEYGVALARVAGRATLRLAQADVLPFTFTGLADAAARYLEEVTELTDELRQRTEEENRWLEDGTLLAAADPLEPLVLRRPQPPVPYLAFAPLQNAVARLRTAARAYAAAWERRRQGPALAPEVQRELDGLLLSAERTLTRPEGLPGRPWYRHLVYAPGRYTGYGVKTFPAVREAVELRDWKTAEEQVPVLAAAVEAAAARVDAVTALVEPPPAR